MTVHALSERIIGQLPEMTPQLALGARFIVDHPDAMVISSMREIAGRVGVAPATLLRLARVLGYEDWSRFRDVYVDSFRSSSPHYAEKADELSKRQGVPGLGRRGDACTGGGLTTRGHRQYIRGDRRGREHPESGTADFRRGVHELPCAGDGVRLHPAGCSVPT